jgi:homoserine kinase
VQALDDRLHEPYRTASAPVLGEIKQQLPAGALGATLSGSGPTVIVWAPEEAADACAAELSARFPDEQVLRLQSASSGAGVL